MMNSRSTTGSRTKTGVKYDFTAAKAWAAFGRLKTSKGLPQPACSDCVSTKIKDRLSTAAFHGKMDSLVQSIPSAAKKADRSELIGDSSEKIIPSLNKSCYRNVISQN